MGDRNPPRPLGGRAARRDGVVRQADDEVACLPTGARTRLLDARPVGSLLPDSRDAAARVSAVLSVLSHRPSGGPAELGEIGEHKWWKGKKLDFIHAETREDVINNSAITQFVEEACRFGHGNLAMEFIKIDFRVNTLAALALEHGQIEIYNELTTELTSEPYHFVWPRLIKKQDASIIVKYILKNPHNFNGVGLKPEHSLFSWDYARFEQAYMATSEPAFKFLAQREIYVLELFASIYDPYSLTQSWHSPRNPFMVSTPLARQRALEKTNHMYIHTYWLEKISWIYVSRIK